MKPLTLLTGDQYYNDLLEHLPQAKHQIVMAALSIAAGPRLNRLFELVEAALVRGVQVHILADNYTKTRFAWDVPDYKRHIQQTVTGLQWLEHQGARVSWVGPTKALNPFGRRCHIKATIIDDRVYSFGGINLVDDAFAAIDYMTVTANQAAADRLARLIDIIGHDALPSEDQSWPLNEQSTILVDAGRPHQSIIYDRACALAGQAKRVIYVSQMGPSGRLAKALRQTDTQYYYTRPAQMGPIARQGAEWDQWRWHTQSQYHGATYLHAKFILFELKDNTKTLLSGSNNFSYRGVAFGTKEIALDSTDEALWNQLHDFWSRRVQQAV